MFREVDGGNSQGGNVLVDTLNTLPRGLSAAFSRDAPPCGSSFELGERKPLRTIRALQSRGNQYQHQGGSLGGERIGEVR